MNAPVEPAIRPDWMFEVRSTCQTFYCKVTQADRYEFESALEWLGRTVPPSHSPQELDALVDRLKICTIEAAAHFHQAYHRQGPAKPCSWSAIEATISVWNSRESDARLTLRRWTDVFLSGFDMAHPPSPAEKAAGILRTSFCNSCALDDLALQTATSRSALARGFRRQYGFSRGEYLTRVRLRWFIAQIRGTDRNATCLAREAGYESYHNLVDALRLRTGLTPTEVRRLDRALVDELLHGPLALGRGDSPH